MCPADLQRTGGAMEGVTAVEGGGVTYVDSAAVRGDTKWDMGV